MTLDELRDLIAGGESDGLEFQETTGQRGEACRTLCAFLNGNGGVVVFGVSRKGKLTGQLVSDETKRDLARSFCDFEPGIEIPTEYVPVDESHQAIVCRVAGGTQKPYAYAGRPYRRVQSTTVRMPQEQYALLIAARGGFQSKWELQWDENASLADVDLDEVTRTAKIAVAEGRLSQDVDVNDPKDLLYTVFTRPTIQEWKAKVGEARHEDNAISNEGNEGNHEGNEGNPERILKAVKLNPKITISELVESLLLSHATIERVQKSLQKAGRLRRIGGTRGHWEVCELPKSVS